MFKNWLNRDKKRYVSCSGSPIVELFHGVVNESGDLELVSDGKTSLYAEIQSHKDSCDINLIIQRFANGDVSALNVRQGQYFDATEMPKTMAEALNMVIEAERQFNELPVETKSKFDHDYKKYIASAGTKEWFDKLGFSTESKQPVDRPVSPVSEISEVEKNE